MRIPIPIAILVCTCSIVLTWWLCIKDKDFISPPSEDALAKIKLEWEKQRPQIPKVTTILKEGLAYQAGKGQRDSGFKKKVEGLEIKNLPTEDKGHAPGLKEYSQFGGKGSAAMFKLATDLEEKAFFMRALLAWERLLDSTKDGEIYGNIARGSIKRLKKNLPPWNPDSQERIEITLHLGAIMHNKDSEILVNAMDTVSDIINEASENIIYVKKSIHLAKPKEGRSSPHMEFWFLSRPLKNFNRIKRSPFTANLNEQNILTRQLASAIYYLVRFQLKEKTKFAELPNLSKESDPEQFLRYSVTRLMWREFARGILSSERELMMSSGAEL